MQCLDQLSDTNRPGHAVVDAGGQAFLAVAGHGVGRHRDDVRALPGLPPGGDAA
jgi:hypothetical protein